jgi:hypothetical protein
MAGGEVSKLFNQLPRHSYLRIKANYHFIDAWQGGIVFIRRNWVYAGEFGAEPTDGVPLD